MIRTLRAFAWLRWRMLMNSLEKTGTRDTLERFSLAVEKLGPIIAGILMIPSAIALAGLGAAAGYAISGGEPSLLFETCRYILLIVPVLTIVGPLLLPAADRNNPIRMLLLPISRRTLYVAQAGSAFADPWILLMLPIVVFLPPGLLAGGGLAAALVALSGGALLVVVIIGIASLGASLMHLAVRDRRRGELLALVAILLIPMLSMLPGLIGSGRHRARKEGRPPARERLAVPPAVAAAGERAFALLPTELYVTATRAATRGNAAPAAGALFALAAMGALLHGIGLFAFGRVLDSPGSTGARRAVPMRAAWGRTLPGLSPGASAVALAQLRLALRTPRGRSILLSPLMMFVIVAVIMRRNVSGLELGMFSMQSGLSLASFASFVCLMSVLPIAMNQFAVDKAGLTMALLSPLRDTEYLAGKAVGNALIAAPPALFCVLAALAAFPGGPAALWLAIPLALLATYLLAAPAAAAFSAIFPRPVDLNSIGRGSNAHGLSGLLGMAAFLFAGVPNLLIVMAATRLLHRPSLAPVFLLLWCAVAYGLSRLLFIPAVKVFARRRENLALIF